MSRTVAISFCPTTHLMLPDRTCGLTVQTFTQTVDADVFRTLLSQSVIGGAARVLGIKAARLGTIATIARDVPLFELRHPAGSSALDSASHTPETWVSRYTHDFNVQLGAVEPPVRIATRHHLNSHGPSIRLRTVRYLPTFLGASGEFSNSLGVVLPAPSAFGTLGLARGCKLCILDLNSSVIRCADSRSCTARGVINTTSSVRRCS